MALVFDNIKNTAQTHALVIGVGGYRFLAGGVAAKPQLIKHVGKLNQLTSPPKSAIAFKDALLDIENHNKIHFSRPLGSIEMLVSPSPNDPNPGKPGEVFEPATKANITNAYNLWRNRCDTHEDNVAIFFFCGHGVEKEDHFLLMEDFGINPINPWMESFSFDKTRRAFHAVKAKTQCFFIDSCRQITGDMLQKDLPDVPLEPPDFLLPDCDHDLTIKAAAHNETAHGPKKKPSYFTQVLLRAFDGAGASKEDGVWKVTTGNIATRTDDILKLVKSGKTQKQRFPTKILKSTPILIHDEPPLAHLSVSCNPPKANRSAEFKCQDVNTKAVLSRPSGEDSAWELEIRSGLYELSASFQNGDFNNHSENIFLVPPGSNQPLNCS